MKAVTYTAYGSPDVLQIIETQTPQIGDHDILVEVFTSAVNTSDVRIRRLDTGPGIKGYFLGCIMRMILGIKKPRANIMGSVLSGRVVQVGSQVSKYAVGDEIFALTGMSFGAYAQYCKLSEKDAVAHKPQTASFAQASALCFGGTAALYFLRKAKVDHTKHVLIYGSTGSVGSAALQIAQYFGASVDAVCGKSARQFSSNLGAQQVFDYHTDDWTDTIQKYDIIFDAVGKIHKSQVKHLLSSSGIYVTVDSLDVAPERTEDLELLAHMFDAGKLKSVIDSTYAFDDIQAAHEYVDTGHKRGSVVVSLK